MNLSINSTHLTDYVNRQLSFLIPDFDDSLISKKYIDTVLMRIEFNFQNISRKYYEEKGVVYFNHLNSDHYCMFLYYLSNSLYNEGELNLANKVFLLNKAMHSVDIFYSVELPDIFYLCHPLGTVLGAAKYENYFVAYQGVTVGSDLDSEGRAGNYPVFSEGVTLLANSTIVGGCNVGGNVIFAANSFVRKMDIPDNTIVTNQYPKAKLLNNKHNYLSYYFGKKECACTGD